MVTAHYKIVNIIITLIIIIISIIIIIINMNYVYNEL